MEVLSSLRPDIVIPSDENAKKKLDSVLFYNRTKVGVDVVDQMARLYSVKAPTRNDPKIVIHTSPA